MQHRQVLQTKNYNAFNDNVRRSYQVHGSEYQYPRKQGLTMGGEMQIVRSGFVTSTPRMGRGGNLVGWRGRSYEYGCGPMAISVQADLVGAHYYSHVPDLIQRKNAWNSKTKRGATRSDRYQRQMNASGDYLCESRSEADYTGDLDEFVAGYPVEIGTRDFKKGFRAIEAPPRVTAVQDSQQKQQQRKPHGKHNADKINCVVQTEVAHSGSGKNHSGKRRNSSQRQPSAPSVAHRAIRGRSHNNTAVSVVSSVVVEPVLDFTQAEVENQCLFSGSRDEVQYLPKVEDLCLFSASQKAVKYLPKPNGLFTGGQWDKLSDSVWKNYVVHQQSDITLCRKIQLYHWLRREVKAVHPQYELCLVGSTVSGFGCDASDVDFCLVVRQTHMDQRGEAVVHLERVKLLLSGHDFILDPIIIQAKVPILRYLDERRAFQVDLNCNNTVGIRNTHLQYCYSQLDWRVRPLVLIVKLWAQKHRINDAKYMTISSYSLVLMVIHFLQCGVSPPVLPNLQDMFPDKFNADSDVTKIVIHETITDIFVSSNLQTIGELLHDFLAYYVNFKYGEFAISVRLAAQIPIEDCRQSPTSNPDPHQWKNLCVEEPFDLSNTARSVYDPEVFEDVKSVFSASLNNLRTNCCLDSMLYSISDYCSLYEE